MGEKTGNKEDGQEVIRTDCRRRDPVKTGL